MIKLKIYSLFVRLCFIATIILVINGIFSCSPNLDSHIEDSRKASAQLGKNLKSTLIHTIQTDGVFEAIQVCNLEAQNISSKLSEELGLKVGRTSLKTRNPKNAPDNWEKNSLHEFAQKLEKGTHISELEKYELLKKDDQKWFRYMKAIPMQEPCALCHGETIAPQIEDKIKSLYPQDQAIGFELGEIRGAFTVKIKL